MDGEFRLQYPIHIILQTSEVDNRGLYGAILRPRNPKTGRLDLPFFTDADLADRAAAASKLTGVSRQAINSPHQLIELVTEFITNGGKDVAIDPIADGKAWWDTFDAEGFLRDVRNSLR
jgi:hypothetical protein